MVQTDEERKEKQRIYSKRPDVIAKRQKRQSTSTYKEYQKLRPH